AERPLHLNVKSSRGQNSPSATAHFVPWSVSDLLEGQRPADVICQMPVSGQCPVDRAGLTRALHNHVQHNSGVSVLEFQLFEAKEINAPARIACSSICRATRFPDTQFQGLPHS